HKLAGMIGALDGYSLRYRGPFFREFVVACPTDADAIIDAVRKHGVLPGIPLSRYYGPVAHNLLLVTATDRHSDEDFELLCSALARASLVKVG
ncbi:MAG TPA: glycine dehydrogenase, partial [Candidatus Krumholzibacteria bacterium]|nr:glycine dehydrogenase [Candidatus Krumholzibacteria bacterium]